MKSRGRFPFAFISLFVLALILALLTREAGSRPPPADWPGWRGPRRDAVSTETGLIASWTEEQPKLLWQTEGLGSGYSSVAVAAGRIFTLGERKGGAKLIALDLETRKPLWQAPLGGGSPNSTPTVDGDLVFALGRDGHLICARAKSGDIVWKKDFAKDFGGKMMSDWGFSESPLVDGEKLVCTPGGDDAMVVALDKEKGDLIWKGAFPRDLEFNHGQDGAAYSSIVVSNAAGVKQYVQLVGRGLIAVDAKDGKFLWAYNRIANDTANIPTPIVKGDHVFTSTGYGTGAALLRIVKDGKGLKAEEVYFLDDKVLQNHHGGMVLVGDHLYCGHGHNQGFPLCIEMLTGKVAWRPGRGPGEESAAVLYADGHLYFRYQDGTMALIEANPREYRLKGSFKLASIKGESWPHPVIAGGKLFLRDQEVLMCYQVSR